MKRLLALLLASSTLFGDEPPTTEAPPKEEPSQSLWDYHPIHVGGTGLWIGQANVTNTPEGGNLRFNKANAFLYMLLPISAKSYFFPRVEWTTFEFDWDKNPKFNKERYYYASFALTFYSTAIEKWRWILRANYNIDVEHFSKPHDYSLFDGLVWGAYELYRKWHYHIGAFGYTGFEGTQMYPIIGFDYSPNKKWTLQIIFPIDYSVQYKVGENWRFSLLGRPLKERFRTSQNQPQPRSIFSYSSMGAELNAHYERFMRFEAEAFIGYNFGGSFYIKDAHNHNTLYANMGGAPYAGAKLDYAF